ncbi:hypothetical protein VTN00DRAFT_92 [Thermoascus crustaceus]|uniref:uncharacterized protein n=1 Tax=Thermoascus crustaceus TaxID=5088 RepID=UPI00374478AD
MEHRIQHAIDESQEVQDKGIKAEFRNLREIIDRRFEEQGRYMDGCLRARVDRINKLVIECDDRFNKLEAQIGVLNVKLSNSRISHLSQTIHPVPIVEGQGLKVLLEYYQLEKEMIRRAQFLDLYGSEKDMDEFEYTEDDFTSAVESDPQGAVFVLGSHLGVNCHLLQEKVAQLELQLRKGTATEGPVPPDCGSIKARSSEELALPHPEGRSSDSDNQDPQKPVPNLEFSSEEFSKHITQLRFCGQEISFTYTKNKEKDYHNMGSERQDLHLPIRFSKNSAPSESSESGSEPRACC